MKKKKGVSLRDTIYTTVYAIKYLLHIRYGCIYIIAKILYAAIKAGYTVLFVILPGMLIDALVGYNSSNSTYLATLAIFLVLLPLVNHIIGVIFDRLLTHLIQKIDIEIAQKYFMRVSGLDYQNLESPDMQVLQEQAESALNSITGIVNTVSDFVYCTFSLFGIGSVVTMLHPLLVVLICIILFINSFFTKKTDESLYEKQKSLSKLYIQQSVFPFMLTHIDYGKEIRIFHLAEYLVSKYTNSIKETNKQEFKNISIRNRLQLLTAITAFIQSGVIYCYMIMQVVSQAITIGDFTVFLNATNQFSSVVNQFLNSYLQLSKNSLAIEDMQTFFSMPQKVDLGDKAFPMLDKNAVICFENVSFSYPGSSHLALDHLNLTIFLDECLCIVGENGSGKSTLIKLLMRLYTPSEGRITINGVDIQTIRYEEYRKAFSAVFQDFAVLSLSLKENIVLSAEENDGRLDSILKQVGLDKLVSNLERGVDTCIDKDIDENGITLSGGEAQKMAIARALYQGGRIYILDEPTAALDPNAEYEIYTQFHNMIKGKTAIMITHRLSAIQLSDRVAVLADGHVKEYGTHAELYAKGGIYTEMFDKQAQFYRDPSSAKD